MHIVIAVSGLVPICSTLFLVGCEETADPGRIASEAQWHYQFVKPRAAESQNKDEFVERHEADGWELVEVLPPDQTDATMAYAKPAPEGQVKWQRASTQTAHMEDSACEFDTVVIDDQTVVLRVTKVFGDGSHFCARTAGLIRVRPRFPPWDESTWVFKRRVRQ